MPLSVLRREAFLPLVTLAALALMAHSPQTAVAEKVVAPRLPPPTGMQLHVQSLLPPAKPDVSPTPVGIYVAGLALTYRYPYPVAAATVPQERTRSGLDLSYSFSGGVVYALSVGATTLDILTDSTVGEYPLGQTTPQYQLVDRNATGPMATDSAGNVYIFCLYYQGSQPAIVVYPYGTSQPTRVITQGISAAPTGLAIDHKDNLYVDNGSNIVIFRPNALQPSRTITDGINGAGAMTFDKFNKLFVANSGSNSVSIYSPDSRKLLRQLSSGIDGPTSVAVGPGGTVYVLNSASDTVTEYDHEQPTLSRTVQPEQKPMQLPVTVCVDYRDALYVVTFARYHIREWIYGSRQTHTSTVFNANYSPNGYDTYGGLALAVCGPTW